MFKTIERMHKTIDFLTSECVKREMRIADLEAELKGEKIMAKPTPEEVRRRAARIECRKNLKKIRRDEIAGENPNLTSHQVNLLVDAEFVEADKR